MSILRKIFSKKKQKGIPPMPSWDEIVEHMQSVGLDGEDGRLVRLICSNDRSRRILILRSENGFYQTRYEVIGALEPDEINAFGISADAYPAWWEPGNSAINKPSFYATAEDALREVSASPEFTQYFQNTKAGE